MKKTVIIVIASRGYYYNHFIKNYWIPFIKYVNKNKESTGISIYLLFGEDSKTDDLSDISNNIIIAPYSESLENIYYKTIFAFKTIKDYDIIFRTNLSSFIVLENFMKIVESLPDENVYRGSFCEVENNIFVSGCGFFLSKDIVDYCINNIELKHNLDDVNFGYILKHINKIFYKRLDLVDCVKSYLEDELEDLFQFIINNSEYHIRLKNKNRNIDIQIATFLTKKFYLTI